MRHAELTEPSSGWTGQVVVHGHFGRPVLVFPSEGGSAWDFENNGMVEAVRWLVDGGRVKFYCVDSADSMTWADQSVPLEERARRHDVYESWILQQVLPFIDDDLGGGVPDLVTLGCSMGAFHAANIALRHADLFPLALCLSGSYDPSEWNAWGDRGTAAYFHNPMDYLSNLDGDHLEWLRSRVRLVLVVGQGAWEVDPTRALPSTLRFGEVLAAKGIPHELDVWGFDVPHDWPSWQRQLAHHLPRFC
ncbi:MAG: esterase family protein [Actinomycetes bacterium]